MNSEDDEIASRMTASNILAIRVFQRYGRTSIVDNRRLCAIQEAVALIRTAAITAQDITDGVFEFIADNGSLSVGVRGSSL